MAAADVGAVEPSKLDVEKWEFEKSIRERELRVKEHEQVTKEAELRLKETEQNAARWRNPLSLRDLRRSGSCCRQCRYFLYQWTVST